MNTLKTLYLFTFLMIAASNSFAAGIIVLECPNLSEEGSRVTVTIAEDYVDSFEYGTVVKDQSMVKVGKNFSSENIRRDAGDNAYSDLYIIGVGNYMTKEGFLAIERQKWTTNIYHAYVFNDNAMYGFLADTESDCFIVETRN